MRKQLRFRWTEGVTTTAGHVATSLIPTDTFTQDFINKAIGISAGVYESSTRHTLTAKSL
jgi:hypothetical protein